jgi:hypothetical protein
MPYLSYELAGYLRILNLRELGLSSDELERFYGWVI